TVRCDHDHQLTAIHAMTTTSSQRSPAQPGSGEAAPAAAAPAAAAPAADGAAPAVQVSDSAGGPATARENTHVDLGRLAWLATVLACRIAVLVLVLEGYYGYAGVTFAVAMSAGINLT